MKTAGARFRVAVLCMRWVTAGGIVSLAFMAAAQQPSQSVTTQREAMHKLAFLVGQWSGPITVFRGPREPLRLTQREDIEFKLDGLVLLIQGKSTGADGKTHFDALATVAYDDISQVYRIRAYHDGHYVDAPLTVIANGFSWGFLSGPAKIENTMHLTAKGEWQETTEVTVGERPPQHTVEMLLTREP